MGTWRAGLAGPNLTARSACERIGLLAKYCSSTGYVAVRQPAAALASSAAVAASAESHAGTSRSHLGAVHLRHQTEQEELTPVGTWARRRRQRSLGSYD